MFGIFFYHNKVTLICCSLMVLLSIPTGVAKSFAGPNRVYGSENALEWGNMDVSPTPTSEVAAKPDEYCVYEREGYLFYVTENGELTRVHSVNMSETKILATVSVDVEFSYFDLAPMGDVIVYAQGQDDQQELFLMDNEGAAIRQLTQDQIGHLWPRFSPDGDKIAFSSLMDQTYDITIVDLEGNKLAFFDVDTCRADLDWLDNDHLLITVCANHTDISILDLSNGEITALISEPGQEFAPNSSSDGKSVLYTCMEPGESDTEICVFDIASREISRLTDNSINEYDPSWSADSNLIVYTDSNGINEMLVDWSNRAVLLETESIIRRPIIWNLSEVQKLCENETVTGSEDQPAGSYEDMSNRECSLCHDGVHQTHMERGVITTEYRCQDCHRDVNSIHTGLDDS